MANKSKRILTAEQFEACRPYLTGIADQRLEIAFKVMVLDKSPIEVSQEYKVTPQAVSQSVARVWKQHEKSLTTNTKQNTSENVNLPPGWSQSTFVAPDHVIKSLKEHYQNYMDTAYQTKSS